MKLSAAPAIPSASPAKRWIKIVPAAWALAMPSGLMPQLPSSTPTTPHTPNALPPALTWTPTIPTVSGTMGVTSPSPATLVPAHAPGVTLC